jgi:hypothetical protein
MWIARDIYDSLNESRIKAEARERLLEGQITTLNAHLEWMRVRLTEMSFERAEMLKRYLHIDVPVPSFEDPTNHPDPNQTMDFSDIGDEAAKKLGIDWNSDGTLSYAKT